MASSTTSHIRQQAQYIDMKIEYLERKLTYPEGIFRLNKILDAENMAEEIISENKQLLQSVEEEEGIAEHNIGQMDTFLEKMKKDVADILTELTDMEVQMKKYGYVPMVEAAVGSEEDSRENKQNGNDVSACEEQLNELSLIEDDDRVPVFQRWNQTPRPESPSDPVFSKYYYMALRLPIPAQVLNNS